MNLIMEGVGVRSPHANKGIWNMLITFVIFLGLLHIWPIKILYTPTNVDIYIYKEELKTVVREFLACTQSNRHETTTALWNPYRRVSLRGRRAQIRFSRGARGENPENDRPPFWFYGESIRTSVHGSKISIVGMSFSYGAP